MIQFDNFNPIGSEAAMNVMCSLDAALEREKEYSQSLETNAHNATVTLWFLMMKGAIDFSKLSEDDIKAMQSLLRGDYEYSCTMEDVTDDSV